MRFIPPNSTIGLLGGGQLARMTAMAAARLGYKAHVFCPDDDAPALSVCAAHTKAEYTDIAALTAFARQVSVVTLEWENVPLIALETLDKLVPLHPSVDIMRCAQDRRLEKTFAREHGVGTAPFWIVESEDDLALALKAQSGACLLKTARMGYDGKGQRRLEPSSDPAKAWAEIGKVPCILESFVDFSTEVSVIVARRADGALASFPVVDNTHRHQILSETRYPALISPACAAEAQAIAETLAKTLNLVGLLAVEMFVLKEKDAQGRRVIMNEMAPRPHNSGHWTIDACACSQFEQLVRAITGLPLGDPTPHSNALMRNLIGDDVDAWMSTLENPQTCLHLYGKTEKRAGRKMGHVTILTK